MRLFIILQICTFFGSQQPQTAIFDGVYFYEYAIKKPNQINIGFIAVENGSPKDIIEFTISYSNGSVKTIQRKTVISPLQVHLYEKNGVLLFGDSIECYSDKSYIQRKKKIPDDYYLILSPSFFDLTNKERLRLLERYCCLL